MHFEIQLHGKETNPHGSHPSSMFGQSLLHLANMLPVEVMGAGIDLDTVVGRIKLAKAHFRV